MHAQLVYFDGPRSAELIAAHERADTRRIIPALTADPAVRDAVVAMYVLRTPDGGDILLVVADSEAALRRGNEVIAKTPLLPDEDPALLPGADRIETYPVVRALGRGFAQLAVRS